MAIDTTRSLTAVGIGVVDEVLEYWDAQEGTSSEPFQNKRDLGRLILAGIGYGLQAFVPAQARLGETLALAATPLLVKSVAKPLRATLRLGAPSYSYVARSPVSTAPILSESPSGARRIG